MLYNMSQLIIGLLLVFLYIYNRFLRVRSSVDLLLDVNLTIYVICLIIFIFSLFVIVSLSFSVFGVQLDKYISQSKTDIIFNNKFFLFFSRLIAKLVAILNFIKESVKQLHVLIVRKMNFFTIGVFLFLKFFFIFRYNLGGKKILVFVFQVVPYLCLSVALLLDVFVYSNLYYFFKMLIILAVPLFFNVLMYSCWFLCIDNSERLRPYISIEAQRSSYREVGLNDKFLESDIRVTLNPDLDISKLDFDLLGSINLFMNIFGPGRLLLDQFYMISRSYTKNVIFIFYLVIFICSLRILLLHSDLFFYYL